MPTFDDTKSNEQLAELHRKEEESLVRTLAPSYGYDYIDLRGITFNPTALNIIPEDIAKRGEIVAYDMLRRKLYVAIRNPNNKDTQAVLASLEKKGYQPVIKMCSTESLKHGWARYADGKNTEAVEKGVLSIDVANIGTLIRRFKTIADIAAHIAEIRSLNNAQRVSETLETIFAGAVALGASDIHIEPEATDVRLRYRLDGVLHNVLDIETIVYQRLISRLKLLSGMILNSRSLAQDGRFTFALTDHVIEVRSSVIPGASGESIVMRLLDPSVASFNMNQLGLNPRLLEVMTEQLQRPNGLIITTGPTGSGKTTALYAFLRETHEEGVKIITVENPVEYKIDDIVQTQVDGDYTFASGLRAILRQDPDIIMIGEIRDREVAETAIHAAQTGHLVFSTLHTNSAVAGFPRLMDLGVDSRILGTAVNVMLGQRLVRLLCQECREAYAPSPNERTLIENILAEHPQAHQLAADSQLYRPVGCEQCSGTGYTGRQAVFEAILMDTAVEEAVLRDPREHIIWEAAKPQGIPTMAEDGMVRVLQGETSLEELQRVVDLTRGRPSSKLKEDIDDNFGSHVV